MTNLQQTGAAPDMRLVYALLPLVLGVIQFVSTIGERLKWSGRARREIGPYSWILLAADDLWQYVSAAAVFVVLGLLFGAVIQGAVDNDSLTFFDGKVGGRALFENAVGLAILWLVLAFFIRYNFLCRLALFSIKRCWRFTYRSDCVTAQRHIREDNDAIPINVDRNGCALLANGLLNLWQQRKGAEPDAAYVPAGLTDEQRANFIFFACLIEGQLHELGNRSAAQTDNVFSCLSQIVQAETQFFSPASLREARDVRGFYSELRSKTSTPTALPDEPIIAATVSQALEQLMTNHNGSSRNVAETRLGKTRLGASVYARWSAKKADRALSRVSGFQGRRHQGERAQFLKLCLEHGVFPHIRAGPFIFPFSRRVAKLLFDTNCILVPADVDAIALDLEVEHVVAYAEQIVAEEVRKIAHSGSGLLRRDGRTLQVADTTQMFIEVDYLLWSAAGRRTSGTLGWKVPDSWGLEGGWLKRGKGR